MKKKHRVFLLTCSALLVLSFLQISVSAQAKGMDVTEVRIAAMGTLVPEMVYRQSAGKAWQVVSGGKVTQTCNETSRDEWSVYLACADNVTIVLDLFKKERSIIGNAGSTLKAPIASSSNAPVAASVEPVVTTVTRSDTVKVDGTNVAEVTFGTGGSNSIFRKGADKAWQQIDPAGQVVASCNETNRDQWSVYLSCPSNRTTATINLFTKKVASRAANGSETALGNVVSASEKATKPLQATTRSASVPEAEKLESPLSPEDLESVMAWIADEVSNARTPYCYRKTIGRGVGAPLSGQCSSGLTADAGLCYTPCRPGYGGVATRCYKSCPAGFRDDGLFCGKPAAYTRPGFPWTPGDPLLPNYSGPTGRCEAANGKGKCEQDGAVIYPKCKEGFRNIGSNICSPVCPSGMNDIGVSCAKDFLDRGLGVPFACSGGLERDGLLCYPTCKRGFNGIGPVCWQQCNGVQKKECGIGCADSADTCAQVTSDMVLAPINMIINLATMGLSSAATSGASAASGGVAKLAMGSTSKWASLMKAVEKAAEVVDKTTYAIGILEDLQTEVDRWTDDFEGNFTANTSPAINARIDSEFGPKGAKFVKRAWAQYQLTAFLEADGWRIGKFALSIASIEPTGIVSVINAYAHPMCKNISPDVQPASRTDGTNVATVTYKTDKGAGSFRMTNDKEWRWQPPEDPKFAGKLGMGQPGAMCEEIRRDQWSVYLKCQYSRFDSIEQIGWWPPVTINLFTKKVTIKKKSEEIVGDITRTGNDSGFNPWPNVTKLYR